MRHPIHLTIDFEVFQNKKFHGYYVKATNAKTYNRLISTKNLPVKLKRFNVRKCGTLETSTFKAIGLTISLLLLRIVN